MPFEPGRAMPLSDPAPFTRAFRRLGKPVCLVPVLSDTLHAGHFALIRAARSVPGAVTLVAAPFAVQGLEKERVDATWHYDPRELTPRIGFDYEPLNPEVPDKLARLIALSNSVGASDMFLGEKDYELLVITQRVVNDYRLPLKLHSVPVVRMPDGLAVSGRNVRVPESERELALVLAASLTAGVHAAQGDSVGAALGVFEAAGIAPLYLELRGLGLGPAPREGDVRLLGGVELPCGVVLHDSVGWAR
ncbi:pantoate--beta-alanine ligase [Corynebacterium sp. 153RC1]|uniref:pantoate--beta-alanine ligase n=1 Tax=Corynebacterium TaxID=1716 RepID=UPI00211C9705|nr:pantoate--beta-alanine ligase [Corynebacterium sp. 76QC2CO]MCQ9353084.1 pantoate--beta-alanine ligase [Corynebacterium sp. 209RC1]MCQ9355288.1 pantoate--beta-alanine ligase [Corynebacterium sp. 1222RC1]MCQ9357538.1 pantoate--beta-alanine ligase [Corynebacterium sp. 122RC1]MCQ9359115.1 pantoate--beta-alanine ligase [Corynebacterium sp. 142RC1]MCQ9361783.1 pantoate--beta-alanine ligase [Corynebacterium sp. 153RC1]MCQ9366601.1 pantoate--beta-alanine ligase [Corynebacterium sp. 70RC1]